MTHQFGTEAWGEAWSVVADDAGVVKPVGRTGGSVGGDDAGGLAGFVKVLDSWQRNSWTHPFGRDARDGVQDVILDDAGDGCAVGRVEGSLG